jgi:hypothetical protein
MLNFNLFESINLKFSCFGCCGTKNDEEIEDETHITTRGKDNPRESYELDKNIYKVTREYKISILPITADFDIENLYPLTDHVELWNIFIVGNDKTYILANVNDPHILIPNINTLPNKQAQNILPDELIAVFNSIWSKTLTGKQLQFYMVWNSKLYFVNTYPFFNGKSAVIGAIMFMRAFEKTIEPKFVTTLDGTSVPSRVSEDTEREIRLQQEQRERQRELGRHMTGSPGKSHLSTFEQCKTEADIRRYRRMTGPPIGRSHLSTFEQCISEAGTEHRHITTPSIDRNLLSDIVVNNRSY